jgi:hypothetical protein
MNVVRTHDFRHAFHAVKDVLGHLSSACELSEHQETCTLWYSAAPRLSIVGRMVSLEYSHVNKIFLSATQDQ